MTKKTINIILIGLLAVIIFGIIYLLTNKRDDFGSVGGIEGTYSYYASGGHNQVITPEPAVLQRVIIGSSNSGQIQISDHESSTTDSIIFSASATDLKGVWDIGAYLHDGLVFTTTNQNNVIFIWDPR